MGSPALAGSARVPGISTIAMTATGQAGRPGARASDLPGRKAARVGLFVLIALLHAAGVALLAHFGRDTAALIEPPITVALLDAPRPLPPVATPARPAPQAQLRTTPAPPRTPPKRVDTALPHNDLPHNELPPSPAEPPVPTAAPQADPAPEPPRAPSVRNAAEQPPPAVAARFDAAYLNNPAPAYPALSRRLREEGRVLLRVHVTAEGLPTKVNLAESSGFGRLDAAAHEAVLRWRFIPAKQDGHAIDAWVHVPIVFKLEGN